MSSHLYSLMEGWVQMVKVIYGKKGTGKTRALVTAANDLVDNGAGHVVFIDSTNKLMHDLKRQIRFINASEFPVKNEPAFFGFVCGIISGNYDVHAIFMDELTHIVRQQAQNLQEFFNSLKDISDRFGVDFYISMNGEPETMPEYLREFI